MAEQYLGLLATKENDTNFKKLANMLEFAFLENVESGFTF